MIFTLAEIALSVTWKLGTWSLSKIYNGLIYLYYGDTRNCEEGLNREELLTRISILEQKIREMRNENPNKKEEIKNDK